MTEKGIKNLESVSKALFIFFVFFAFYHSYYRPGWEILCFGRQINGLLLFAPLILAIILGLIAISKRKKYGLPTKESLRSFSKFLIFSIIFFLIISVFLCTLCGHRGRARDARIQVDLAQIRIVQEKFYKDKGRYAVSLEELEGTGYFPGILDEAKRYNIIFEKDGDLNTWKTYAFIREYQHEICRGIKEPRNIYICNKNECWQETIK